MKLLYGNLFDVTELEYEFKLNSKTNKLNLQSFSLICDYGLFFKIYNENGSYKLNSDILDVKALSNSRKDIVEELDLNSLTFGVVAKYSYFRGGILCVNPFSKFISTIVKVCTNDFLKVFYGDKISHVSPLRAFPQRYYLLDKTILRTQINTSDGNELAEVLKKRSDILKKINTLFAKFELLIKVVNVNNIIHRIIVVQNNVDLEITDVGFGISQVLPILVQAYLSPRGALVIIEQPEIHLHPNMQAWLIDALINISLTEGKYFLIETHSEPVIRRIRRRIAEIEHPLNHDNVIIYNVQRNELSDSSELKCLDINEHGDVKWPKGFLDTEMDDMLSIQQSKMNKMRGR
ncbi:AAA family ATPase [Shewanella xiamenensis]|nr:AAA family ATPase [Shewanella xiamenensis]MDV5388987.1 AAA family ATPase [Shewanella xiamenensis]